MENMDCTKMGTDSSAEITPICLPKPKSLGFKWKKASLGAGVREQGYSIRAVKGQYNFWNRMLFQLVSGPGFLISKTLEKS